MRPQGHYSRRELARTAGCSLKALRHYERHNLVSRSVERGRRRYDEKALGRLRLVVALRRIGLSTTAIARLLALRGAGAHPAGPAPRLDDLLSSTIQRVAAEIEAYQRVRAELVETRETIFSCGRCEKPVEACGACVESGKVGPFARVLLFDP